MTSVPPTGRRPSAHDQIPLLAGTAGALLGGALWALIAGLTDREVGYVAWGIGGLTGFLMAKASQARGRGPALAAAAFAAFGLLFGKVLLHQFVLRPGFVREVVSDEEARVGAAAWHLRREHAFPPAIQTELDAVPEADTLSDALWERMLAAGREYLDTLPEPRRNAVVMSFANASLANVPMATQLSWHFSPFDLLWFFLALTTAYRMLAGPAEEAPPRAA